MEGTDLTSVARQLQSRVLRYVRSPSLWVPPVALGTLYFVYGLLQLHNYGVTWDEPLHRNWGKLLTVFWKTGDRSILELMPGHGIDYGPLYYVVNYGLSEWLYGHGFLRFVEANHVLNLITASVAVGLTFILGRTIAGTRTGFIAAGVVALYPQLLAHAQYNPKDIPLMTAVLLTGILFVAGLRRASRIYLLLSAFFMGAALAVKVSALLMAPVFGITYLVWALTDSRSLPLRTVRAQTVLVGVAIMLFVAGAFIFWPSAWGDPMLIPRAVGFFLGSNFWPGQVLYFGVQYGGADLPWHYTLFEFFGATPLVIVAAFLAGTFMLIRRVRDSGSRAESVLLLLWVFLPLLYSMRPGFVRYDGIRQFFFLVPAASLIVAIALDAGLLRLRRRWDRVWVLPALAVLLLADLSYEISVVHPFEGSYRNELIRALYPSGMNHAFEVEYWGATYKQGMTWLIEHADPDPVICVPTAGVLVEWYPWRSDFSFACGPDTTYVMFFSRYSQAEKFGKLEHPVFTIRRMDADLLDIYRVTPKKQSPS